MAIPNNEEMTARDLAQAAVEAVTNAVHQAEKPASGIGWKVGSPWAQGRWS